MKQVYANRFLVRPPVVDPPQNLFLAVQAEVKRWAAGRILDREGTSVQVPDLGKLETPGGSILRTEGSGDPEKVAIWRLVYEHPEDGNPTRRWRSTVSLAVLGDIVEVVVNVAAGKPGRQIDPDLPRFIDRPRIVRELFARFPCGIEGMHLEARPTPIADEQVEAFVAQDLMSSKRTLPVVVISTGYGGEAAVDPSYVAAALAGLARTFTIDPIATYALTDTLGHRLSVFDGGVRIYWPDFAASDPPARHDLFLRRQLELLGRTRRVQAICRPIMMLAAAAAIEDGPLYQKAKLGLLQLHFKKSQEEARLARDAISASRLLKARENEGLAKAIEALTKEMDAQRELIVIHEATIESQNEELENLRQTLYYIDKERSRPSTSEEEGESEPRTVLEAVERAAERFPILNVWDSARDTASRSVSNRAQRVSETLEILAEVADEYFSARRQGKGLGVPIEDVFRLRGAPKYANQDSETTSTMYREEHTFSAKGRSIHFRRHFTIKGRPQDCIQIYFEFDETNGRVDVGYVGEHLPWANDNS